MSNHPARRAVATLALVSLPLLAGACGSNASGSTSPDSTPDSSVAGTPGDEGGSGTEEDAQSGDLVGAGAYTAGTYEASADYQTPDGRSEVGVEVTIDAAGTIEEVQVTPLETIGNSFVFQTQFAEGIADVVVGQPIHLLAVSKVAGSSLTSGGFNTAIEQIIADATT